LKNNLSENIVEGISYKQIRDVFKKIGFGSIKEDAFAIELFINEIKNDVKKIFGYKPSITYIKKEVGIGNEEAEMCGVQSELYLSKTNEVLESLLKEKLIEKHDSGRISITEDGHRLRMQKALNRIPLKKAEALMIKMLKSLEQYNNDDDAPFLITQVYVYGSVQRHEKDAGDIDIAINYAQKRHDGESYKEYSDRIYDIYGVEAYDTKILNTAFKALKVSPYISVTNAHALQELMKKGADARLLYSSDEKNMIDVDKYEFKTIKKENNLVSDCAM
jgi:predicted nucleotidyltransferase